MTLLSLHGHLPYRPLDVLRRPSARARDSAIERAVNDDRPDIDGRVFAVQRIGAVAVGGALLVFGLLGATGGVGFLATSGQRYLGLSSNGLLSALSLVVATVLLGAAVRGPRPASTVMIVLGVLFLLSALLNMALLRTPFNLLAFRMSNVVFSVVVGLLLLFLGAYGRISGNLPANSPYARPHAPDDEAEDLPSTPEEFAAEADMREAEIAVVQHYASAEQRQRVLAMSQVRSRDERRRAWLLYDERARS
jgi:uncharacterized protein DUF4383